MSEGLKKNRPQYRNIHFIMDLPRYRMPLAAIVSFAHRVSGAFLFLLLPYILYLLEKSLVSEISFEHFKGILSTWYIKILVLLIIWAYIQHFCSGIRHLFGDAHIGLTKDGARKTAASVLIVSLVLTAAIALKLFGVF